jgi:hypothetical protein
MGQWAVGGIMWDAMTMSLEKDANRRLGEVLATAVKVGQET